MTEAEQPNPAEESVVGVEHSDAGSPATDDVSEPSTTGADGDSGALSDTAAVDAAIARSADTATLDAQLGGAGPTGVADAAAPATVAEVPLAAEAPAAPEASAPAASATKAPPELAASDQTVSPTVDPAAPADPLAQLGIVAPIASVTAEPALPQTVYVAAPVAPKRKSNRWFATMVAAIAAVPFAALYALVAYITLSVLGTAAQQFTPFLAAPVFWGPVVVFFLGFALLGVILNCAPAWAFGVFGLLVGVLVYFSWIGFALVTRHVWAMTAAEASEFLRQQWLSPYAILSAVIARESVLWFGSWIARNGRAVTVRNRTAMDAYERELAAGVIFQ